MLALRSLRALFSTAILLLVGDPSGAAESVPNSALALADAMQAVETFRLTMEARTKAGIEKGHNSQKELECWKATDFTPVRRPYAEALARVMTSAEMEEATAFLTTPVGRKFVQYTAAESLRARGWSSASESSLTEEESEAAQKFLSTGAGSKLFSDAMQSPELIKGMIDTLLPMLKQCIEPKSVQQHFDKLEDSMTPAERERATSSAADTTRPSQADAVKLIRAMREDELFLTQFRHQMKTDPRPVPQVRRACVEKLKPTDFSSAMAVAVQERLSAAEVKDATEFYESGTGRKFTDIVFQNIERATEVEDFFKVMTIDEAQSLRKFFVLSASRKLMQDQIIQEPASLNRVMQRFRELLDACLRESGEKG